MAGASRDPPSLAPVQKREVSGPTRWRLQRESVKTRERQPIGESDATALALLGGG